MEQRAKIVKPGLFSIHVHADSRRGEFDFWNEIIVTNRAPVDFVFIGDSITHMWELEAYFGRSGKMIINRGISGDTSEYLLKRYEADALQLNPQYIILKIGVNDTWALEDMEWARNQHCEPNADYIENRIVKNITAMVNMSLERKPVPVLCSILPTRFAADNPKNAERNEMIVRVNEKLKELALKNNLPFVDYHSNMTDSDGKTLRDGLADDGLHPNVFGYNVMAEVLRKTLSRHGIEI